MFKAFEHSGRLKCRAWKCLTAMRHLKALPFLNQTNCRDDIYREYIVLWGFLNAFIKINVDSFQASTRSIEVMRSDTENNHASYKSAVNYTKPIIGIIFNRIYCFVFFPNEFIKIDVEGF